MKVSYNWLKDYIKTDLTPEKISEILTETGLEVDGIEKIEGIKGGLSGVFVGEVLSCEKHPDADKLKITSVSVGGEPLQIVCGAPNVSVGQKVICATIGAVLYPTPDEVFKIKASKIRGIESNGMLCAEDELGLGKSHEGILILPPNAKVGTPAASFFELEEDYQIEIGLTPNRADAMGHIGVARDLVAYLNVHLDAKCSLLIPKIADLSLHTNEIKIAVQVIEKLTCPTYLGISIKKVNVKPSPAWLQKRLRAVGLSPINSVVDCTNYVMRELGTPLHAFDASKLHGKVIVKRANQGDLFTTLDGIQRTLHADDLMICNANDYIAIAGVFGGLESGISSNTTDIFIESAYFNPVSIRKTAKRHALNTDASFRYERGVDPQLTKFALERVVYLIQEICGGEIAMELVSEVSGEFERKIIDFNIDRCNKLIGKNIPTDTIALILENLDIKILTQTSSTWSIEIPDYRVDVLREVDVIEEVLRIYGYNNIELPEKLNTTLTLSINPIIEKIQSSLSEFLVGLGLSETLTNSLTTSSYSKFSNSESIKPEFNVEMMNPLSLELDVMRQSLIFSALEVVSFNQNRQQADLSFFEFGKTYKKTNDQYIETKEIIICISGRKNTEQWNNSSEKVSFFTLKGIVIALFKRIGLTHFLSESPILDSLLEDGVSLSVLKQNIGELGWVSADLKKYFGIKQDVFIAVINWDVVIKQLQLVKVIYKELPKTFEVRRDFSLLLNKEISFFEIEKIATGIDRKLLKRVALFDVYAGSNLEKGKKSYAVSFHFQDNEKTLQDAQVDVIMNRIRKELEEKLNAQLR